MSKGQKALDEIKWYHIDSDGTVERCEIIEKELKALEIIKRTSVNPIHIQYSKDYNDFQNNIVYAYERVLTKEEFDLLKEVFDNE